MWVPSRSENAHRFGRGWRFRAGSRILKWFGPITISTEGTKMTLLESLKKYTTVVADTGDIESIARYKPQDATTNPSLLYAAAQKPQYAHLVEKSLQEASDEGGDQAAQTEAFMDHLSVNFGREILDIVPGRVSTEVDAGLSFDTE